MRTIWQRTFKLRVALNMLVCALVFGAFGSLPRETISGFLGRRGPHPTDVTFLFVLMAIVDALHPKEEFHCFRVAREEDAGWRAMYPERYR